MTVFDVIVPMSTDGSLDELMVGRRQPAVTRAAQADENQTRRNKPMGDTNPAVGRHRQVDINNVRINAYKSGYRL